MATTRTSAPTKGTEGGTTERKERPRRQALTAGLAGPFEALGTAKRLRGAARRRRAASERGGLGGPSRPPISTNTSVLIQMTRDGLTAGERLLLRNHLRALRHRVAAARMEATA